MSIYFDHAATTPVSRVAAEAMIACLADCYGNPSSVHAEGRRAAALLADARKEMSEALGAKPEEIYFTSGGTESDNWAIQIAARAGARRGKKHIISTAIEHHAILHPLESLSKQGYEVTLLPVDSDGLVSAGAVSAALREDTALVTVMYANNEIGVIEPIAEISALCREKGVLFHTDAVQAVGHLPINVSAEGMDMLSLSGHKFGGPKGVGVLYCRRGVPISAWMEGGAQERNRRGGTENLPAIVGMVAALKESLTDLEQKMEAAAALRDKLIAGILTIPRTRLNGHPVRRLPGNINVCFEGIEGEGILLLLDMAGICGSSGSACTSGSLDPSHVLLALGLPHEIAHGSLRLSIGDGNTEAEIDRVLEVLPPIIARLRALSPVWVESAAEGKQ